MFASVYTADFAKLYFWFYISRCLMQSGEFKECSKGSNNEDTTINIHCNVEHITCNQKN